MLNLEAIKSTLPAANAYFGRLAVINQLDGFKEWVFEPGMLFGEKAKWWGGGERTTPHEGIDLLNYRDADGNTIKINPGMKIPAIFKGTVTAIKEDFLGKSIFIRHPQYHETKMIMFTAYGHTEPKKDLFPGSPVKVNEIIGSVAGGQQRRTKISGHLHISTGWMPEEMAAEELDWDSMAKSEKIILFDPRLILNE
jgi:hypothetical protein